MPDQEEEGSPKPAPRGDMRPARTAAGAMRRATAGVPAHPVIVAPRARPPGLALPPISRRRLLQAGLWTGIGATLVGGAASLINMLYPRGVTTIHGSYPVGKAQNLALGQKNPVDIQVPDQSNPLNSLVVHLYITRLNQEQAARNPGSHAGWYYAFWRKCPHLGCTVPYDPNFTFTDPRTNQSYAGWFRCPCHGSTYSDTGVKVFGPAPRSLDMYPLTIAPDGTMTVNVSKVLTGGPPLSDVDSTRGVKPPQAA